MSKTRPAPVRSVISAAVRDSRLRARDPLYIQDTDPAQENAQVLSFASSSPLTGAVIGGNADTVALEQKYRAVLRRARRRRIGRLTRLYPKLAVALPRGVLSVALYALLFTNERKVLELSLNHWWSFMVPVSIALVFSLVHGSFTGAFWEAVGLKPNTVRT